MDWQEILTILIPIAALLGFMYKRIDKKFDESKLDMNRRFDDINRQLSDQRQDIRDIRNEFIFRSKYLDGNGKTGTEK